MTFPTGTYISTDPAALDAVFEKFKRTGFDATELMTALTRIEEIQERALEEDAMTVDQVGVRELKVQELRERIRKLSFEKLALMGAAAEASKLLQVAARLPSASGEKALAREESRQVHARLVETEGLLAAANHALQVHERVAARPGLVARLERAKKLASEHARLSTAAQRALETLNGALSELDGIDQEFLEIEREEGDVGMASMARIFHPMNSPSRLLPCLAGCLSGTSYGGLVRVSGLKSPGCEDFAELSRLAVSRVTSRLENEIAKLDMIGKEIE